MPARSGGGTGARSGRGMPACAGGGPDRALDEDDRPRRD
jgi:hypothetical protein